MLEAGIEMGLKTKFTNDGVVVAIDVSVNTIHSLEDLTNHAWEGFRKWNPNSAWENCLIVNVTLNPCHQVFDVRRSGHFGGPLVGFGILPEILKFICSFHLRTRLWRAELGN